MSSLVFVFVFLPVSILVSILVSVPVPVSVSVLLVFLLFLILLQLLYLVGVLALIHDGEVTVLLATLHTVELLDILGVFLSHIDTVAMVPLLAVVAPTENIDNTVSC